MDTQPPKIPRDEVDALLEQPQASGLELVPLSVGLHADDLVWAEEVCSRLAGHPDAAVRANALVGFAHLARRFHNLSFIAQAIVQASQKDPDATVREQAVAAVAELRHSLRPHSGT